MTRGHGNTIRETMPVHEEDLIGLPYPVIIRDAAVCEKDADTGEILSYAIPDLDGFVAAVAMVRALMPVKLSQEEVRFMRKVLDLPAKKIAEYLAIDPSTYSRWENGRQTAGELVERMFRHHVCAELKGRVPAIDFEPSMINKMKIKPVWPEGDKPQILLTRIVFKDGATRRKSNQWDAGAIAA